MKRETVCIACSALIAYRTSIYLDKFLTSSAEPNKLEMSTANLSEYACIISFLDSSRLNKSIAHISFVSILKVV